MICLWILQTSLYHCYFNSRLFYYLVKSSFLFFNFDRVMPKSVNWNCRKHFGVILTECSPSSLLHLWVVYLFFLFLFSTRSFLNGLGRFCLLLFCDSIPLGGGYLTVRKILIFLFFISSLSTFVNELKTERFYLFV